MGAGADAAASLCRVGAANGNMFSIGRPRSPELVGASLQLPLSA